MNNLLLRPEFEKSFARLHTQLPQSILLHGISGVGLHTIASSLAPKNHILIQPITSKGDIDDTFGTISIEKIRHLQEQVKGKSRQTQVVIIDDADRMSHGAQNAFLKLLEEPNTSTRFILTSHNREKLLPTVRSRVHTVFVPPITTAQSAAYLEQLRIQDARTKQQLLFIAKGRPAELYRLSRSPKELSILAESIQDARSFLGATMYEKLIITKKYATNRQTALRFTHALLQLLSFTIYSSPKLSAIQFADKVIATSERLMQNANPKLQLLTLVVQ
jgi:DNA polymerase-3 subunit delta'